MDDKISARLIDGRQLNFANVRKRIEEDIDDIVAREREIGSVYFDSRFPLVKEPFKYMWEAARCYSRGLYLSAIALSAAMVELTWNLDPRLKDRRDLRKISAWVTLNSANMLIARSEQLPVENLMSEQEQKNLTKNSELAFVIRRNKVAHGDIAQYITELPGYSSFARSEALDQIKKGDRYFVDWHNQLWFNQ